MIQIVNNFGWKFNIVLADELAKAVDYSKLV